MIPQQELQKLIGLPVREKLELARLLIDSSIDPTPRSGEQRSRESNSEKISFLSLAGIYDGPTDTAERADEICQEEIKQRSGFTLKEELL